MDPGLISGIKRPAQAADIHVDLHVPCASAISPWIAITRYVSVDYIKGAQKVSRRLIGTGALILSSDRDTRGFVIPKDDLDKALTGGIV